MNPAAPRLLHESLLSRAAQPGCAHQAAVIVEGTPHTYAQLLDAASRLASALIARGVERGDRVALFMDNGWPCVVSIYAVLLAGGAFVPINPQTRADKLGFVLDDCGARLLLTEAPLAGRFLPACTPQRRLTVICAGDVPGDHPLTGFDDVIARSAPLDSAVGTIPLDLAALIYTSGSTGDPKGVMQTHQSMVFVAGSMVEYLRQQGDDRILCTLPLAFGYGLYQLLTCVMLGATLVLERSFAYPAQVFSRMHEYAVTTFPGVPTLFAMLLSAHQREPLCFPRVTTVTNAGAALSDASTRRLRAIFPNALIYRMYGLTECQRVCYLQPELLEARPDSVGKAIPGTEVLLLSAEGQPVAAGETGILHVRGPHVMLGYWNRPELSAQMLQPGRLPGEKLLCTQDQFRMDADGFLYFVGRSDDIIKTRGEKVSPVEVENAIHAIAGIREVAVIGVDDELLGQAIHAHVVLEPGTTVSIGQIRAHCVKQLENFMVPQRIVLCTALPRTGSGKISKKMLLEQSRAETKPAC